MYVDAELGLAHHFRDLTREPARFIPDIAQAIPQYHEFLSKRCHVLSLYKDEFEKLRAQNGEGGSEYIKGSQKLENSKIQLGKLELSCTDAFAARGEMLRSMDDKILQNAKCLVERFSCTQTPQS